MRPLLVSLFVVVLLLLLLLLFPQVCSGIASAWHSRAGRLDFIPRKLATFRTTSTRTRSVASIQRSRGDGFPEPVCLSSCRIMRGSVNPLGTRTKKQADFSAGFFVGRGFCLGDWFALMRQTVVSFPETPAALFISQVSSRQTHAFDGLTAVDVAWRRWAV